MPAPPPKVQNINEQGWNTLARGLERAGHPCNVCRESDGTQRIEAIRRQFTIELKQNERVAEEMRGVHVTMQVADPRGKQALQDVALNLLYGIAPGRGVHMANPGRGQARQEETRRAEASSTDEGEKEQVRSKDAASFNKERDGRKEQDQLHRAREGSRGRHKQQKGNEDSGPDEGRARASRAERNEGRRGPRVPHHEAEEREWKQEILDNRERKNDRVPANLSRTTRRGGDKGMADRGTKEMYLGTGKNKEMAEQEGGRARVATKTGMTKGDQPGKPRECRQVTGATQTPIWELCSPPTPGSPIENYRKERKKEWRKRLRRKIKRERKKLENAQNNDGGKATKSGNKEPPKPAPSSGPSSSEAELRIRMQQMKKRRKRKMRRRNKDPGKERGKKRIHKGIPHQGNRRKKRVAARASMGNLPRR